VATLGVHATGVSAKGLDDTGLSANGVCVTTASGTFVSTKNVSAAGVSDNEMSATIVIVARDSAAGVTAEEYVFVSGGTPITEGPSSIRRLSSNVEHRGYIYLAKVFNRIGTSLKGVSARENLSALNTRCVGYRRCVSLFQEVQSMPKQQK
jgi:hypothetical protein